MSASPPPGREAGLEALFRAERRRLFGLAYRLTGSSEDAEDVVQEAFVRLTTTPPAMPVAELGPWLANRRIPNRATGSPRA